MNAKQGENMIAEYIDRQAAIEAIDESLKHVFVLPVGKSIIDKIPAADVRLVVRGEWIDDGGNKACSECHKIWLYRKTNFCPNCGARMDV